MTFLTSPELLVRLLNARTSDDIEGVMSALPIVAPDDYQWDYGEKRRGMWREGHLHWVPVGLERGNGGRIKLAGEPMNPIAERLVNGMEAIIELARLRELLKNSTAQMPMSPREAVLRLSHRRRRWQRPSPGGSCCRQGGLRQRLSFWPHQL